MKERKKESSRTADGDGERRRERNTPVFKNVHLLAKFGLEIVEFLLDGCELRGINSLPAASSGRSGR